MYFAIALLLLCFDTSFSIELQNCNYNLIYDVCKKSAEDFYQKINKDVVYSYSVELVDPHAANLYSNVNHIHDDSSFDDKCYHYIFLILELNDLLVCKFGYNIEEFEFEGVVNNHDTYIWSLYVDYCQMATPTSTHINNTITPSFTPILTVNNFVHRWSRFKKYCINNQDQIYDYIKLSLLHQKDIDQLDKNVPIVIV